MERMLQSNMFVSALLNQQVTAVWNKLKSKTTSNLIFSTTFNELFFSLLCDAYILACSWSECNMDYFCLYFRCNQNAHTSKKYIKCKINIHLLNIYLPVLVAGLTLAYSILQSRMTNRNVGWHQSPDVTAVTHTHTQLYKITQSTPQHKSCSSDRQTMPAYTACPTRLSASSSCKVRSPDITALQNNSILTLSYLSSLKILF